VEQLLEFIQTNAQHAHYIIFSALLLAGFNLPVSEDAMLFISGFLASKNPELLVPLFLAVYLGAYFSDMICYWLGRLLGPKLWEIKFFANMISKDKVDKIHGFYERYGFLTLLVGRFIPFGVRNGLFLTAGLGKMNFPKFASADFIACTISCSFFFTLYYKLGDSAIELVKKGNLILIIVAIVVTTLIFFKIKSKQKA
jgi:membrane protein DedA with SNARE-associated domain